MRFFIEITDTYGGEANYSWVTRHVIKAKSGATCAFINECDASTDNDCIRLNTDERKNNSRIL